MSIRGVDVVVVVLAVGLGACGGGQSPTASPDDPRPVPSHEPAVPTSDCSGAIGQAVDPVLVDVTIGCDLWATEFTVARGAGDAGFVAFTAYGATEGIRLISVDGTGSISALAGPVGSRKAIVLTDATGAPHLTAGENPDKRSAFFRLEAGEWQREPITPPPTSTLSYTAIEDARFTTDGRVVVAGYDVSAWLATRAASGEWSRETIPDGLPGMSLAIDANARPHVLFTTEPTSGDPRFDILEWLSGIGTATLWSPLSTGEAPIDAAPIGERAAAAALTMDGIHVIVPGAAGAATDRTVPATPYLAVTGCPQPPTVTAGVSSWMNACTETGDGVYGLALAANDDGLWLAYFSRHIDRDVQQSCGQGEGGFGCSRTTTADRSTGEVVLVAVPADATSDPRIVWRAPANGTPGFPAVSLDGSGARLSLAEALSASTVHYWTIDTSKL
jgi:hypothetical protein